MKGHLAHIFPGGQTQLDTTSSDPTGRARYWVRAISTRWGSLRLTLLLDFKVQAHWSRAEPTEGSPVLRFTSSGCSQAVSPAPTPHARVHTLQEGRFLIHIPWNASAPSQAAHLSATGVWLQARGCQYRLERPSSRSTHSYFICIMITFPVTRLLVWETFFLHLTIFIEHLKHSSTTLGLEDVLVFV